MKCLITGGAGFIGSHIQDRLIELGHSVAVVDNLRSGKKSNLHPQAKFYEVDVRDKDKLETTFSEFQPEAVFHLAAQNEVPYSMTHPYEDLDINITGMVNLLEASKNYGVKKVIYSNTGGAYYGDVPEDHLPVSELEPVLFPTSFYGTSKAAAEQYLRLYGHLYGLPWVALRYSNVYGPRQTGNREAGVVAIFTDKLLKKEPPTIFGDGSQTRDYVFVLDVVAANIAALTYSISDSFNISTGVPTTTRQVFDLIETNLKTGLSPLLAPSRPGDAAHNTISPAKAKKLLGWSPQTDFSAGIKLTVQYYLSQSK